jgi:hypothetical protein
VFSRMGVSDVQVKDHNEITMGLDLEGAGNHPTFEPRPYSNLP